MKNFPLLFLLFFICACKSNDTNHTDTKHIAKDNQEDLAAAQAFLQASLNTDYTKARAYMLSDSLNNERMDAISRARLSDKEKEGLKNAKINIIKRSVINDSTSIIIYSNSYHAENTDTLKLVKTEGQWLVDFKYLFDHEQDTIQLKP